MSDSILLTIPAEARFRGVATLVLGGIGARLDLPYERMDDLQLALLSTLDTCDGDGSVTVEVEAGEDDVAIRVGPLEDGGSSDAGLLRVLHSLVDSVEPTGRDDQEWITLRISRTSSD
ncbi:MAG: hypothetical protein ACRDPV_03880 [Gaiellaceae bacterium]